MGKESSGIAVEPIAAEPILQIVGGIQDLVQHGVEVGIVIGGGNIFRGIRGEKLAIQRTPADQMGMLATIINGIALSQALEQCGVHNVIMSAIDCHPIAEPYQWQKALEYIEQKKVVIFVGGTGSPYFTTDTAAALRASEIHAEALLKATKVNGVYSQDPLKFPDAIRYTQISYREVLAQKLDVMDATAIALAMSNRIPILVFDMWATKKFSDVLHDTSLATIVS